MERPEHTTGLCECKGVVASLHAVRVHRIVAQTRRNAANVDRRNNCNDWVVQYQGHFLQLQPHNKRYGPTQATALISEWEDGAVEVHYRGERVG
jgi:hypothetical protein